MSAEAGKEIPASPDAPLSLSQAEFKQAQKPTEIPVDEEAPDPDEDDLSDLDDVLDEFAATNLSNKPAPSSSGPGRPAEPSPLPSTTTSTTTAPTTTKDGGAGPGNLFASEDDFAKAMQAGMAELLGEFESNPEMAKQFEDLVKELGEGMGNVPQAEAGVGVDPMQGISKEEVEAATAGMGSVMGAPGPGAVKATEQSSSSSKAGSSSANAASSFEDTIRATMERMSASNNAATASTQKSAAAPEEDFLAAMLKEMEKEGGAGGLGSDEDFSKMLMGMMEQLTNKEILYEPMKELNDKFPGWMKENEGKVKKEDWERYVEQRKLVGEIVGKFEEKGYSDSNTQAREYIVERMQQMQAAGSPPPDLVGDMNAAQEALGDLDAGCPQQ